jgi:hypothetical protein
MDTLIISHTVPLSRFFGTLFHTSGLSLGPPALLPPAGIGGGAPGAHGGGGGAHGGGGGAPGAHGGGGAPGAHGGGASGGGASGGGASGGGASGGGAHGGGASGGGATFPTLLRLGVFDLRGPGVRPGVPLRDRAGRSSAGGVFLAGEQDFRGRFLMATSSSSSSRWLVRGSFSAAGDRVGRRFRMWTTSSLSIATNGVCFGTCLKSRTGGGYNFKSRHKMRPN